MHGLVVEVNGELRVIVDTETRNTSLVITTFHGSIVAWHESPNIVNYAEQHKGEIVDSVEVSDKEIMMAKMYIAMQEYFRGLLRSLVVQT